MFIELMTSNVKDRELRIRESLEKKKGTRGRKKSKKMRSSEIRIAVAKRVKGLSNYLFFSALMDLQKQGSILKKKNLLNMKYTFYVLSVEERGLRLKDSLPREHISGIELKYMMRTYQLEKDLIFPQRFLF